MATVRVAMFIFVSLCDVVCGFGNRMLEGESPVGVIMVVEEKDCVGLKELV